MTTGITSYYQGTYLVFTFLTADSINLNTNQLKNLTMYVQALKLGLENIRDTNKPEQFEIWAEDIKKEIAQRRPRLAFPVFLVMGAIFGIVTLAIALTYVLSGKAAIGGAPMEVFLSLLLIWLLSKLQ